MLFLLPFLVSSVIARQCYNISIPVTIAPRLPQFNVTSPKTLKEIQSFVSQGTNPSFNASQVALANYTTLSPKQWNIAASLCLPVAASSSSTSSGPSSLNSTTLLFLIHGIGFSKAYWDLPAPYANYSFVSTALDAGFATLAIDRPGIGYSSRGDPINEIQGQLEVATVSAITKLIRNGTFASSIKYYTGPVGQSSSYQANNANLTWNKIVHIGHSFGSAITAALVDQEPSVSDGAVLTGFSLNSTYMPYFLAGAAFATARSNQPLRLGSASDAQAVAPFLQLSSASAASSNASAAAATTTLLANYGLGSLFTEPENGIQANYTDGYYVSGDAEAGLYLFFSKSYSPAVATYADATKWPVTPGELLTLPGLVGQTPSQFTGSLLIVTGADDLPFCGGACENNGIDVVAKGTSQKWPSAKNLMTHLQPKTGHGLNFHWNATAGYDVITSYLKNSGL